MKYKVSQPGKVKGQWHKKDKKEQNSELGVSQAGGAQGGFWRDGRGEATLSPWLTWE